MPQVLQKTKQSNFRAQIRMCFFFVIGIWIDMLISSKDSFEIDGAEQVSSIKPSHPRTSQKDASLLKKDASTHAWLRPVVATG